MSTYKELVGTAVRNYSGNPDNPIAGQVWYDSLNSEFKYQENVVGAAWATGNPLNTARRGLAGAGEQTAALAFGGYVTDVTGATESYNGTSWTSSPNSMNTARRLMGNAGTQTAALGFGGLTPGATLGNNESWNGTSWTEIADLNTARRGLGGCGVSNTSALAFGGYTGTANVADTESWNGTSWTELNDLNITRNGS